MMLKFLDQGSLIELWAKIHPLQSRKIRSVRLERLSIRIQSVECDKIMKLTT